MSKLEEFESRMREALEAPREERMNHELSWPVHKIHYEKNRYLFDLCYKQGKISEDLLKFLIREKIADGPLMSKWKKPGYENLCSLAVITRTNTNFGTVGICRTPLKDRSGQIMPNVLTGCVCCVSGSGGPVWWDDPVPDIVREQILGIDPGKAHLFQDDAEENANEESDTNDAEQEKHSEHDGKEILTRVTFVTQNRDEAVTTNEDTGSAQAEPATNGEGETAQTDAESTKPIRADSTPVSLKRPSEEEQARSGGKKPRPA